MREEKKQIVKLIQGLIENRPFFLISYKGLSTGKLNAFRSSLADLQAECHIVPNKLFEVAVRDSGFTEMAAQRLVGDTALVSGISDPVALAKLLRDFIKANPEQVKVKMAMVEGKMIQAEAVIALAELPPREILLGQLLGVLQAPSGQLVRVLNAKVSSIVFVLNAFLNKKEQAA